MFEARELSDGTEIPPESEKSYSKLRYEPEKLFSVSITVSCQVNLPTPRQLYHGKVALTVSHGGRISRGD